MDSSYFVLATPPAVYADSLKTLHVFRSWSEFVRIVWI